VSTNATLVVLRWIDAMERLVERLMGSLHPGDSRGEPVGLWMAHLPLLSDGAVCARCGERGCVSTHASSRGIAEQLGKEVSADELRTHALAARQP
jgi:predicted NBD/HSP70 family sugar kinase